MSEKKEAVERLKQIQGEIDGLTGEAERLIQEYGTELDLTRASSYWLSHIRGALTGTGSMITMDETIRDMESSESD